jgi:rhodanese-related sulfurtransferase
MVPLQVQAHSAIAMSSPTQSRSEVNQVSLRSAVLITPTATSIVDDSSSALRYAPVKQRTLADVRDQVAQELAVRAISKAELVDGIKVGVVLTLSKTNDVEFIRRVASSIKNLLLLHNHLFAVATTGPSTSPSHSSPARVNNCLIIFGSSSVLVQRAVAVASSKLLGRIRAVSDEGKRWVATIRDMGATSFDKLALWDVVRKAARPPQDPAVSPPGSRGVAQMLSDARSKLDRLTPVQALAVLRDLTQAMPVVLVDIRTAAQREAEGAIQGALNVERNVLEWRFDPRSDSRLAIASRYDLKAVIFCQDGSASSLAAFALHQLGLLNATDIIGGFSAWKEARLPLQIKKSSHPLGGSLTSSMSSVSSVSSVTVS